MHTFVLVPSVAEAVSIPVILAGGAKDGRSLAAALAMGADAVAMGTRFVASRDNTDWDPAYAQRILDAREAEDIIFSAIYGPSRALPSDGIDELAVLIGKGTDHEALTIFKDERLIAGQRDGDMDADCDQEDQTNNQKSGDINFKHVFISYLFSDCLSATRHLVLLQNPEVPA